MAILRVADTLKLPLPSYFSTFQSEIWQVQCAEKVVSDSLGLVGFVIGLVNSVFNLPNWQVMCLEEFE